jgi:hypothetical protein
MVVVGAPFVVLAMMRLFPKDTTSARLMTLIPITLLVIVVWLIDDLLER